VDEIREKREEDFEIFDRLDYFRFLSVELQQLDELSSLRMTRNRFEESLDSTTGGKNNLSVEIVFEERG